MANIKYKSDTEEYWNDRYRLKQLNGGDKKAEEILTAMKKAYEECYKKIEKEIQSFYGRYATNNELTIEEVNKRLNPSELKSYLYETEKYYHRIRELSKNGKMTSEILNNYKEELRLLSARSYMSRLEELKLQLKHYVVNLGLTEYDTFSSKFKKLFDECYEYTCYELDRTKGFSTGYAGFNEKNLKKAIEERWLGDNFSDRIWSNKDKLLQNLNNDFIQGIALGHNPKKIAKLFQNDFQKSLYNCERLCRTEEIHLFNLASYEAYKENDVERYEFVCALDERTCPICGELDGQIFKISEKVEGANYPVLHPNCRCSTKPYFEPDEISKMFERATRTAKDENNKIYYVPSSMTYTEWKKTIKEK